MRKRDWTTIGTAIAAIAFWLVVLRPGFLQPPMKRLEAVLSTVRREHR